MNSTFKPTYLYIKRHSVTGKCYFGKTTSKDPVKYIGSGKHWKSHCKKYGRKFVETLWFKLFTDQAECTRVALLFSGQQDIVNSEVWLNQIPENGIGGGPPVGSRNALGSNRTPEECERQSINMMGNKNASGNTNTLRYKHTPETCARDSANMMGKKNALGCKRSPEIRARQSAQMEGNKNASNTNRDKNGKWVSSKIN